MTQIFFTQIYSLCIVYFWNKLFKRNQIKNEIDESVLQCEDLLFLAQYLKNVRRIAYVRMPLYHYTRQEKRYSYNSRSLSLLDAYEKLLVIYIDEAPQYASIIEYRALKIYLNFRARSRIAAENDQMVVKQINNGVNKHFRQVLFSTEVPLKGKANICFTFFLPKTVIKIKRQILTRRHVKGQWES